MKHKRIGAAAGMVIAAGVVAALVTAVVTVSRRAEVTSMLEGLSTEEIGPLLSRDAHPLVKGLPIALRSEDRGVRLKAVWAMGQRGDLQYVDDLAAALSDKSKLVQDAAEKALRKIGPAVAPLLVEHIRRLDIAVNAQRFGMLLSGFNADSQVESLLGLLRSSNMDSRRYAAVVLGYLGHPRAVPSLAEALQDSSDVAEKAAFALGQIAGSVSNSAVPALIEALDEERDLRVRRNAAWALGEIGSNEAANTLIHASESRDTSLSIRSLESLGKMAYSPAAPHIVRAVAEKGPFWDNHRTRLESALVSIFESSETTLGEYIAHPDADVRLLAVRAAARSPQSFVEELSAAAKKGEYATRKVAIAALGKVGPRALRPLLEVVTEDNFYVQRDAVRALGRIGDPRAFIALLRAAAGRSKFSEFQNRTVRMDAIHAMGKMGDRRAVSYLREVLEREDDRAVKCATIEALGTLGDTAVAADLTEILSLPDSVMAGRIQDIYEWDTRVCAVRALERIGGPDVIPEVRGLLDSQNHELRAAAVSTLIQLKDTSSVETFRDLSDDRNPSVAAAAQRALKVLEKDAE